MTRQKKIRRVVTCQGSIQLVTALAVIDHREREARGSDYEYENYLVIYDLYALPGQVDKFADFIKHMASLDREWEASSTSARSRFSPSRRREFFRPGQSARTGLRASGRQNRRRDISVSQLAIRQPAHDQRVPQREKNLLRRQHRHLFFRSLLLPDSRQRTPPGPAPRLGCAPGFIGQVEGRPQGQADPQSVGFDAGYFLFPDILGEVPPMRTTLVRKEGVQRVFEKLGGLVDDEYVGALRRRIAGRPVVVLMTSNFSEGGRMPVGNEISAYREFLAASEYERDAVLVVKPHPRDDDAKIRRLGSAVGDLFSEVILLTEAELFFIPFEIY